jgi:hypothetical protein
MLEVSRSHFLRAVSAHRSRRDTARCIADIPVQDRTLMTSTQAPDAAQHWSPRTRVLTAELPALVTRMAAGKFTVDRVMFNLADWDLTPRRAVLDGRTVKLGGFRTQDRNTITVVDPSGGQRITVMNDTPAG